MDGTHAEAYGAAWAEFYDDIHPPPSPEVIDFLVARAQRGPVLELAVGTGRIAIPLLEAGLEVHGVEISRDMLAGLRRKTDAIPIVASDMTRFEVVSRYPLVLLAFNTLFAAADEGSQRGVFRSTAAALRPGGAFVTEAFVPDLGRFDRNQTVRTREVRPDRLLVEYSIHEAEDQMIRTMLELRWTVGGSALLPVDVRYLWPSQVDAMAAESGLELEERYAWYDETPFTDVSPRHVSVYRKA